MSSPRGQQMGSSQTQAGSPPRPRSSSPRAAKLSGLRPGRVMWLPRQDHPEGVLDIDDRAFNHPVVIVGPPIGNKNEIEVFPMTSLNGRALEECKWSERVRDGHIPVFPCAPHPKTGKLLHLKDGQMLQKKTYVNTLKKMVVPLDRLEVYWCNGQDFCAFTPESFGELFEIAKPPRDSPASGFFFQPPTTPVPQAMAFCPPLYQLCAVPVAYQHEGTPVVQYALQPHPVMTPYLQCPYYVAPI
ncbi:hypothetical protein B0T10DRAFT_193853 [Thelonectria olida]|uniref:Uncharacterized protein n=1 Tax=Thelonectria olida TaxID=1576542 RepID=A0A9P8VV70_9HYPO|nr:hypothetical protein B0T10DRAFT_193853 [Thelonectria olida]